MGKRREGGGKNCSLEQGNKKQTGNIVGGSLNYEHSGIKTEFFLDMHIFGSQKGEECVHDAFLEVALR